MKWIVVAIALFQGGWLTFDGTRALIVGDYVTRDGQLGPWSKIVATIGINPRSRFMKCAHAVLGVAWLVAALMFTLHPQFGWYAILVCAIATIWYVPIGTILSAIQLGLLFLPRIRGL